MINKVKDDGLGGKKAAQELSTSGNNNVKSNKDKVKFMCSHGGKILLGVSDGKLKYVGGETRAVVVPRDISFCELKKKLASISEGEAILKYQLIPNDYEALVSVKNDKDLRYMINEYDRYNGKSKLRTFLFPSAPIIVDNHKIPVDNQTRYIYAVNGIVRSGIIRAAVAGLRLRQIPRNPYPLCASAATSPNSPDSCSADFRSPNLDSVAVPQRIRGMHRVHSSPTVCSLNQPPPSQPLPPSNHNLVYHCHQPQQIHRLGHLSPTGPPPERLYSSRPTARSDISNYHYRPGPVAKRGTIHYQCSGNYN